jgi:predicted RNase H-related nuclease YkuK (DUF458 family)
MLEISTIRRPDQTTITYDEFKSEILSEAFSDAEIAVGSDSQVLPTHISFVTVICVHYPGRGGKFFYIKDRVNPKSFPTMHLRLMNEVFLSIEAANDLRSIISRKAEVHIDVGHEERGSRTSKYSKQFAGIVTSSGFECRIKPDSWASYVADRFTKS